MVAMAAEDRRIPLPDDLRTPAIDALRLLRTEDFRRLIEQARSGADGSRSRAVRALGRYERRELTPELLQLLPTRLEGETINAFAQSLRGDPLALDLSDEQIDNVLRPTRFVLDIGSDALPAIARTLGRLPYRKAGQVQAADAFLVSAIARVDREPGRRAMLADLARAAESLARRNARLQPPSEALVTWLRRLASNTSGSYTEPVRVNAMAALIASRGVDTETLRATVSATGSQETKRTTFTAKGAPNELRPAINPTGADELRRLASLAIAGAGSPLAPGERTETLKTLLTDRAAMVRIEAVRAWARQETTTNGCGRLLEATKDSNVNVALTAIDALGDQCPADNNVTDRLMAETRMPSELEWHRGAHAIVSLAKRAPERVTMPMTAYLTHAVWQVRMYAARAAAITKDVATLERLALDSHPNVREAALGPMRGLKGAESDRLFIAALGQRDYQLLRSAANELKGAIATPQLIAALVDALERVTLEKRDTSRDTRLALLERLRQLGSADYAGALVPLLQDFDIQVASSAAATLQHWTGKPQEIDPRFLPRPILPMPVELEEAGNVPARVKLRSGRIFQIELIPRVAPLTSVRFLRLVKAKYYDGLTFHRVVPNFVIQGGSPGANEYMGDGPFMRDEISLLEHKRGTVGLSTRGRDTGDAQFFINLVDNARLDFDYTVFGTVDPRYFSVLDAIAEGDQIASVSFEQTTVPKKASRSISRR